LREGIKSQKGEKEVIEGAFLKKNLKKRLIYPLKRSAKILRKPNPPQTRKGIFSKFGKKNCLASANKSSKKLNNLPFFGKEA